MKKQVYIWFLSAAILLLQGCFHDRKEKRGPYEDIEKLPLLSSGELKPDREVLSEISLPALEERVEYYIPGYVPGEIADHPVSERQPVKARLIDRPVPGRDISFERLDSKVPCILRPSPVFQVHFDNDIYANTDYYFTSGLELAFFHPALAHLPGTSLLAGSGKNSIQHYGIRLVQNLYTPVDPDKREVQYGDRPFASYLLVGIKKVSLYPERSLRVESGIDLGVIGPGAMGGFVQRTVHRYEPVGWVNQVSNDLVVNYTLGASKGAVIMEGFELWLDVEGMAGTLYDNLSGGFTLKAGKFESSSAAFSLAEGTTCRKLQFYVSAGFRNKLVIYDATLQGGMFNKTSVYTIEPGDMNRYVAEALLGLGFAYGRAGLSLSQHFNSAEFQGARSHSWGRITLEYRL